MTDAFDDLAADDHLAAQLAAHGRPTIELRPPGFATLVLLICEQRVSLASGAAAFARLKARLGRVEPDRLLAVDADQLRLDGIPRSKARYLHALAEAVSSGSLDLDGLATLSDDEVRTALTALPGIGPWTADVYLLGCLDRPDIWPVGDRALQVATGEALGLADAPDQAELERIGERWRPHRTAAAHLLWHGYLERRGRDLVAGNSLLG